MSSVHFLFLTVAGSVLTPAMAWASRVFPQPGGPWRRNPRGGTTPSCWYTSGWRMWISSLHTSYRRRKDTAITSQKCYIYQ